MRHLIATLFLVFVNGEIFENISNSFYDRLETSSSKPNQRLSTMQEYVLYLTPDQAQALEATGAVVRPLPQLEKIYQQQQHQLSTKDHTEPNISSNKGYQSQKNRNKELLSQQTLAIQSQSKPQSERIPTVKPLAKFKYSPKPRQEHATWYIPKINNKPNNHSTEYLRHLPNYEVETLAVKPYRAQPLPDHNFETQSKVQTYPHNGEVDNLKQAKVQKSQEPIKPIQLQSPHKVAEYHLMQRYEDIQKPAEIQINSPTELEIHENNHKPLDIQNEEIQTKIKAQKFERIEKPLENLELEEHQSSFSTPGHKNNKENVGIQRAEETHPIIQIPTRTFSIERMQNQQPTKLDESSMTSIRPVAFGDQSNDQETVIVGAFSQIPTQELNTKEEKISPSAVVQQDKISENIAEQKVLINNEKAIQTNLKEIKESSTHNMDKFAIELDKLKKNLGKQNILAEKIATQRVSKKPQGLVKVELALQRRRPLELERNHEHTPVNIPRPNPVSWGILHSIPVPVLRLEKDGSEKFLPVSVNDPISIDGTQKFYPTVSTPFATQEAIPRDLNYDIPFTYHTHEPENLAILRHIWEY